MPKRHPLHPAQHCFRQQHPEEQNSEIKSICCPARDNQQLDTWSLMDCPSVHRHGVMWKHRGRSEQATGKRGKGIVRLPAQKVKGERRNVTGKFNAALEPALSMCASQNWTRNSLRQELRGLGTSNIW